MPNDDPDAFVLRAALSRPDGLSALSRRRFLQAAAAATGGIALAGATPFGDHVAHAAPLGPSEGVLVLITFYGGNDGLNTVVPITNGAYYANRVGLAIPASQALGIGGGFGLHPNLTFVKQLFDAGQVAVVQGVGYPNYDRSHFSSMALWMQGWGGAGSAGSGWIGRWMDALPSDLLRAVHFGSSIPLHLQGRSSRAIGLGDSANSFGIATDDISQRFYDTVHSIGSTSTALGQLGDAIAGSFRDLIDTGRIVSPVYQAALPDDDLARELTLAARLVNADLGVRVIDIAVDGFDTHSNEAGDHGALMKKFDDGLRAFFAELDPRFANRTTIMTASEFGRELHSNGSGGTDHGTANSHFLIGPRVRGGLHGAQPSLTNLLDGYMLDFTVDFRSVYATVLEGWLGADSQQVLGARYPTLDLFSSQPGDPIEVPAGPPSAPGSVVALTPTRILDTRRGLAASGKVGPGASIDLQIAGVAGIPPSEVTSVVLNVTVAEPTQAGYVTVWPSGERRPNASNLNFSAGQTVPNLVMCKLGTNGAVSIHNAFGSSHVVADVVGFFTMQGGHKLVALAPKRLLDTRSSGGGPISAAAPLEVTVAGRGDVPSGGVGAVLLNVTVAEPTQGGYLTVWPAGEAMPVASSLNFVKGQTVPNLVLAKLGAGGKIAIFNAIGAAHVILDVVGYFAPAGATSENVSVSPLRLLDTRTYAKPLGPAQVLKVGIAGSGQVPQSGAQAVVANITVTSPTANGYLTVWPSGEGMPVASSLNFAKGQTVPNLVVCKLGGDGAINLFNSGGSSHVLVDVVGYFT